MKCAQENKCEEVVQLIREYVFQEPAQRVLIGDRSSIWLGDKEAAFPRWATDRGFGAVLSIYKGRNKRENRHLWITAEDNDRDVMWHTEDINVRDTANSPSSWNVVLARLPAMLKFMEKATIEGRELLVHCDTGISTSFAVVLAHMIVKRRTRVDDAVAEIKAIRRQVAIAPPLLMGLKALQGEIDERKIKRLEARLRKSDVLSIAF